MSINIWNKELSWKKNQQKNKIRKVSLRKNHYKRTYGISLEDYNKLFLKQKGCCAICSKHQSELKERLHLDHNHKTNKIRGLLCGSCNRAIGLLREDVEIFSKAIDYLNVS